MDEPDWNAWKLADHVLREPTHDDRQIVLWLRGPREGAVQHWQRIGNVPGEPIDVVDGMCTMPATAVAAKQKVHGLLRKLLQTFQKHQGPTWVLPSGHVAEQVGPRHTDQLLVWSDDDETTLDEARLKAQWPGCRGVQQLGSNVFLVGGVAGAPPTETDAVSPAIGATFATSPGTSAAGMPAAGTPDNPVAQAEAMVGAARLSGDVKREIAALTDLGIVLTRGGDAQRAVGILEEALQGVRTLGDKSRESDVLGNLGLALVATGEPQKAFDCVQQALVAARDADDRFEEKQALERLARAYSGMKARAQAMDALRQAIDLARELGDRVHEAELQWLLAAEFAELGVPAQAMVTAQEAIDIFDSLDRPQGEFLQAQLEAYIDAGLNPGKAPASLPALDFSAFMADGAPPQRLPRNASASGPGLLHMAMGAMKSLSRFIGSGLKVVSPQERQRRLETCAGCEHHTGLRCRLCGCFTTAKTWLPHEDCPIGKWPQ